MSNSEPENQPRFTDRAEAKEWFESFYDTDESFLLAVNIMHMKCHLENLYEELGEMQRSLIDILRKPTVDDDNNVRKKTDWNIYSFVYFKIENKII